MTSEFFFQSFGKRVTKYMQILYDIVVFIFNSDMALHKQKTFIEHVEAKLMKWGKQLWVQLLLEVKGGDHVMLILY